MQKLTIDSEDFDFVRERAGMRMRIYGNERAYVRIGPEDVLADEFALHSRLLELGFPVAKIEKEGELGDEFYYVELSLGKESYAVLFAKETDKHKEVTARTFRGYLRLIERFGQAQIDAPRQNFAPAAFLQNMHVADLADDMTHIADDINLGALKAMERIGTLPIVLTHLDLTPYNSFPKGIIDFGSSMVAPLGFDLTSAFYQHFFYPEEFPCQCFYRLGQQHEDDYLAMLDRLGQKAGVDLLAYRADFILLWACRFAVWPDKNKWKHLRKWRQSKLQRMLEHYLANDYKSAVEEFKA